MVLSLVENVQGITVVKGFAREPQEIAKFSSANRQICDQKFDIFNKLSLFQPLMGFLTQINMIVLLGYGGYLVINGKLALGARALFVFANLLYEFANQVGQITNIANSIQSSLTGAQRVFEVLDAPIEIFSPPHAVRIERARGESGSITCNSPTKRASRSSRICASRSRPANAWRSSAKRAPARRAC